jgi:hypothetical protein
MAKDNTARLESVERKPLKCDMRRTSETFVRGGRIFDKARERCGFSKEQAAEHYGVSHSLMTRQVANQDNQHLSFQRICDMPAAFRREIALGLLEDVGGVEVETTIRIKEAA